MNKTTISKISSLAAALIVIFLTYSHLFALEPQETIIYELSPLGVSEYQDLGLVEFEGKKLNLAIFKTHIFGFKDTEKIYSNPSTNLPVRVERDVELWKHAEFLTEEYIPGKNRLIITKYEEGKKTDQIIFNGKGPIHNAILIPFSLRKIPNLDVGWSLDIRLPDEFTVKLVAIEDLVVPAGKFKTYHFTSMPNRFEIWITADSLKLPVKIKGVGAFGYTLAMKKHILR
jgi:hypothetical protein